MRAPDRIAVAGVALLAAAVGVLTGRVIGAETTDVAGLPVVLTQRGTTMDAADPADPGQARWVATDEVLASVVPVVVTGQLADRDVNVVALTAAALPEAARVATDLRGAGADVAQLTMEADWVDPDQAALRTGLTRQLRDSAATGPAATGPAATGPAATDPSGIDELTRLLARAVSGTSDSDDGAVLAALAGAGLLTNVSEEAREPRDPTTVSVLVAPPNRVGRTTPAVAEIEGWVQVVAAWEEVAPAGVLLAEDNEVGGQSELLGAVRRGAVVAGTESPGVATVDHAATGVGRIAIVRVVARLPDGQSGHYGFLTGTTAGAPVP